MYLRVKGIAKFKVAIVLATEAYSAFKSGGVDENLEVLCTRKQIHRRHRQRYHREGYRSVEGNVAF